MGPGQDGGAGDQVSSTITALRLLGFDVVFAEPDDSSGLRSLESLAKKDLRDDAAYQNALKGLRTTLDYDRRFAASMAKRPVCWATISLIFPMP
jgi:hypothetical protein